jgi:hypothetical protein
MKKLLFLILMLCSVAMMYAQPSCPFHVKFEAKDATCFNNGVVKVTLYDDLGNPMDMSTIASTTNLSRGRCFYMTGTSDTNYASYWVDSLVLSPGTYTVGFEAVCDLGGSFSRLDTSVVVTLSTSYVVPSAAAVAAVSTTVDGFGRHPSLDCAPTGRIQLKIENGRFPYKVTMTNSGGDTLRTVTFNDYMYKDTYGALQNTDEPTLYNYKDYYTFDSLPGGVNYHFYVEDGCGYGIPRTGQIVETISFPRVKSATPSTVIGNDRLKVDVVLDKSYAYYNQLLPTVAKYRFQNDGTYTSWTAFPYTSTDKVSLYDVVPGVSNYCDISSKTLKMEYSIEGCGDTTYALNISISRPTPSAFVKDNGGVMDSVASVDSLNPCNTQYYFRTTQYSIYYETTGNPDFSYYKKPLTWVYTDNDSHAEIKRQTINSVKDVSKLTDADVIARYGSFKTTPLTLHVNRSLVDATGCPLYSTDDDMVFEYMVGTEAVEWKMLESAAGDYCGAQDRWIELYENHVTQRNPHGTVIKLVESPNNNQFNFTATFDSTMSRWNVTGTGWDNPVVIGHGVEHFVDRGRSLRVTSPTLSAGPYKFLVINGCDTFPFRKNINFNSIRTAEVVEDHAYIYTQECSDRYIKPIRGRYALVETRTNINTGVQTVTRDTNSCTFQIISGPKGGYSDKSLRIGDSLRISMRGTYVLKVTYGSSDYCYTRVVYDTIKYSGGMVDFAYANAVLCDSSFHEGNVYVRGDHGTTPYTYILYSEADKGGTPIDTIVGDIADFSGVPFDINQTLSCSISDACNAYFYVNIQPVSKAKMQLSWFDNKMTTTTTCEGTTVNVNALRLSDSFTYTWRDPAGNVKEGRESSFLIPRGAASGWYRVSINDTTCHSTELADSIYVDVTPSPSVEILSNDTTVCPGSEVTLRFMPTSPNTSTAMDFTVTFSSTAGTSTATFSGVPGVEQTYTYTAKGKTFVYVSSISDGTCDYDIPEDTATINMRTDLVNGCSIETLGDTVCFNGTAQLRARASVAPPYKLTWYSDYEMDNPVQSNNMTTDAWSTLSVSNVIATAIYYVGIEKEGFCPSRNGIGTNLLTMTSGTTTLHCGETYAFYDSGGESGNYASGERVFHVFQSDNGKPVSVKFTALDLGAGTQLRIYAGDDPNQEDSLMNTFTQGSTLPGILVSNSGKMTVTFLSTGVGAGWSAFVEQSLGHATADVWKQNSVTLYDAVCQNQAGNYADPYNAKSWSTAIKNKIAGDVKKAGTYTYTYTRPRSDIHGCDSTTILKLTVEVPPHTDTSVTITNLMGSYTWHGTTYNKTGAYSRRFTTADGCDSMAVLYLTILQLDTSTNEICPDDSTVIWTVATAPTIKGAPDLMPSPVNIGDVLCDDGAIMSVDSFKVSGKIAKGVVCFVDSTGYHGWAAALAGVGSSMPWARGAVQSQVSSLTRTATLRDAQRDLNGYGNTMEIKRTAEIADGNDFNTNAPLAYACYYYDHITQTTGTEHKGWYLPSLGQLLFMYGYRTPVNETFKALKNKNACFSDSYCATSTEQTGERFWYIHGCGACQNQGKAAPSYSVARPICNF